jgi:Domain of unknown function (DUF6285)
MRDLPSGSGLLALARDLLLRDLLPLLPPEEHLDARLIANSMAIAEREALAGDAPRNEIILELRILYGDRSLIRPALSRNVGEGPERGEGGEGEQGLLRRFVRDLRAGEFERSGARNRHARDILWRLTIAKLRSANPRFLNANGFS